MSALNRGFQRGKSNRHGTAHPADGDRAIAKATRGNETHVLRHDSALSVNRWAELNFPAAKAIYGDVANQLRTGVRQEFIPAVLDAFPALPAEPEQEPLPEPGSPARIFNEYQARSAAVRENYMFAMSIYESRVKMHAVANKDRVESNKRLQKEKEQYEENESNFVGFLYGLLDLTLKERIEKDEEYPNVAVGKDGIKMLRAIEKVKQQSHALCGEQARVKAQRNFVQARMYAKESTIEWEKRVRMLAYAIEVAGAPKPTEKEMAVVFTDGLTDAFSDLREAINDQSAILAEGDAYAATLSKAQISAETWLKKRKKDKIRSKERNHKEHAAELPAEQIKEALFAAFASEGTQQQQQHWQ